MGLVRYVSGDVFASDALVVVVPVNCVGDARQGLALGCQQRYPEWLAAYSEACQRGELVPGLLQGVRLPMILTFPTKWHEDDATRLEDIEAGLTGIGGVVWSLDDPSGINGLPPTWL